MEAFIYAISIIQQDLIREAREEWKNDEEVCTVIQNFSAISQYI